MFTTLCCLRQMESAIESSVVKVQGSGSAGPTPTRVHRLEANVSYRPLAAQSVQKTSEKD